MKVNYTTIVAVNLGKMHVNPGDTLSMSLHNETGDEGIYAQARRLNGIFLQCYGFYPQSIAIHPDHLAMLKKQNKTLDITFSEISASLLSSIMELADVPRRVPLVADDRLDLFTAVARFEFREEDTENYITEGLNCLLDKDVN